MNIGFLECLQHWYPTDDLDEWRCVKSYLLGERYMQVVGGGDDVVHPVILGLQLDENGEVDVGLPGQIRKISQSDLKLVTEQPQITLATWRGKW